MGKPPNFDYSVIVITETPYIPSPRNLQAVIRVRGYDPNAKIEWIAGPHLNDPRYFVKCLDASVKEVVVFNKSAEGELLLSSFTSEAFDEVKEEIRRKYKGELWSTWMVLNRIIHEKAAEEDAAEGN